MSDNGQPAVGLPAAAAVAASTAPGYVLEQEQRFSESVLWDIVRHYYHDSGPQAWHTGQVPHYATCNTYIAQAYVNVVLAYLRDAVAAGLIDPGQPVYIVELAAGVGRFAFQFLRKLHQLKPRSSLRGLDLRYVMTDFTMTNQQAWRQHPQLKGYIASGLLDVGTFDVDRDTDIKCISGAVLSRETVRNPLVVLGNYAFDTFRTDVFRVSGGNLHEARITIRSPHAEPPDLRKTEIISRLLVQYSYRPITTSYYEDPILNQVLERYRRLLSEMHFVIPVAGLAALRRLLDLSGRRMLLLTSDKGFGHEDELFHPAPHSMQFHTGCLSMMVNYHAIGQWFIAQGGQFLTSNNRHASLRTAACILGGDPGQLADTVHAFHERVEVFGPSDYFELVTHERNDCRNMSVEHVLGLLKLSHFDPQILAERAEELTSQAEKLPDPLRLELRLAIERAWDNYFPGPFNLPFHLARIFAALRRPGDSIRFNEHALEMYGEEPPTLCNMGVSYYYAEQPTEALRWFERALALAPNFAMAKAWQARVVAELERREPPAAGAAGAPPVSSP